MVVAVELVKGCLNRLFPYEIYAETLQMLDP